MQRYTQHFNTRQTPQSEAIPGREMVQNNAGGYTFVADNWKRLRRFLVLGSEGGSHYVGERKLTIENAQNVLACIQVDGARVVKGVVAVSDRGAAPSNDPALFVLAMCAGLGDDHTRKLALAFMPKVARTGTHLFTFAEYVTAFRAWGRGLRRGIARWYTEKTADELAYQMVKYRQRGGWTHRDLLRLAHPRNAEHNALYRWACHGLDGMNQDKAIDRGNGMVSRYGAIGTHQLPMLVLAYEQAKVAQTEAEIIRLIAEYGLPWEALDTRWLSSKAVWEALLHRSLPLTALTRNLGRMTANGTLVPLSDNVRLVIDKLHDREYIRQSRLHPISILVALKTYAQGHGEKGELAWKPVPQIIDALDDAFYLAFENVTPTGKNILLAVDVSGSMAWSRIAGLPLTAREAAAALALVTAKTEPNCHITAFSHEMVPLDISPRDRLDTVIKKMDAIPMGGTDCALPMLYALGMGAGYDGSRRKYVKGGPVLDNIDAFVTLTDNETWCGSIHPTQALTQYREQTGRAAKMAVVGMVANGFSIADPQDPLQADFVGFDTATPQALSAFIQ
jgi:60 kDa SS-A/Ro ribonucleoprotein